MARPRLNTPMMPEISEANLFIHFQRSASDKHLFYPESLIEIARSQACESHNFGSESLATSRSACVRPTSPSKANSNSNSNGDYHFTQSRRKRNPKPPSKYLSHILNAQHLRNILKIGSVQRKAAMPPKRVSDVFRFSFSIRMAPGH
jgi:hypothetical protein